MKVQPWEAPPFSKLSQDPGSLLSGEEERAQDAVPIPTCFSPHQRLGLSFTASKLLPPTRRGAAGTGGDRT